MRGVRGVLAGAFALIVLEVVVTSAQATNRIGGFAAGIAGAVSWLLSTDKPGIPDRSANTTAATSQSTSTVGPVLLGAPATSSPAPYVSINTQTKPLTAQQRQEVFTATGGLT